jgi:hypothetical protein
MIRSSSHQGIRYYLEASAGNYAVSILSDQTYLISKLVNLLPAICNSLKQALALDIVSAILDYRAP